MTLCGWKKPEILEILPAVIVPQAQLLILPSHAVGIEEAKLIVEYLHKCVYSQSAMRYSYDPKKNASNLKKHGLDFNDAKSVIESSQTVTFEDRRFDYGEIRYLTLGLLHSAVVIIATAETDKTIRIISMRKADKHEQKIYYENC